MDIAKHIKNVEKQRDLILAAEQHIWKNPETGFREWKTSAYLAEQMEAMGYELVKAGDIPGFYTDLDTGRPGPRILLFGEMDSLICEAHPDADPETHAVHCCGHHAQCAALLGVAAALKEPGALDNLCGEIRLMAVPAEEMIESEFREDLQRQGTIHYLGGKTEYMYRGYMDGVDMAFMVHATTEPVNTFTVNRSMNGFLRKNVTFKGVAAHAGHAPQEGINALYAATQGLSAINALRETLMDDEHVRVHPIMTNGGSVVNAIPDTVTLESYIRGSTVDAMMRTNNKVNRALSGAAASLGAGLLICDRPGYMPQINDVTMIEFAGEALAQLSPKVEYFKRTDRYEGGSSDLGDLSCVMPVLQLYAGGATGTAHGDNYRIADPESVCVNAAKYETALLEVLLSNGAEKAKEVIAKKTSPYPSMEAFFAALDAFTQDLDAVTYSDDGSITIRYMKAPKNV